MTGLSPPLAELYARAPRGMELGLGPIRAACEGTGHPQRAARLSVHVAGTNGKGSVSAMLERIARCAGHRTGLYTSPHLCQFAERIRVDGEPLAEAALTDVLHRALAVEPPLTFFEAATLAAFLAFRDAGVTAQIVEVGLGGRLDATNVLATPTVTVITSIDLDHESRLGHTLAAIAGEKAGIVKPGAPLVVGDVPEEARAVISAKAAAAGATLHLAMADEAARALVARATLRLRGAHQQRNATVAACAARLMGASDEDIVTGLSTAEWPGRLEELVARDRRFLLDAAHNPEGARALAAYLTGTAVDVLVFGALADKSWRVMLPLLAPLAKARVYAAPPGRLPAPLEGLSAVAEGELATSIPDALARAHALSAPEGRIVVCGSIYLVGEARADLLDLPRDPPVAL